MAKKKSGSVRKIFIAFLFLLFAGGGIGVYIVYHKIYQPNVFINDKTDPYFYIYTGSRFGNVRDSLYEKGFIKNRNTFEWVAKRKNYVDNVKAGRYKLTSKMNNNELINLLRSGKQEPLLINLNGIRFKEDLAGRIGKHLEADSLTLIQILNDREQLQSKYGMDPETILTLFIPDSYQFYWNTSSAEFMERMAKIYKEFWTEENKQKAKKLGLSQSEVVILASIVQAEQSKWNEEKPVVAGLYLNRLKKGMRLESDPTLVYANRIFDVKRVLKADKDIDSPYNTYKRSGLPPGPINLPEASTIKAVLNYTPHNYLFMVAKEDFSGKHHFAKTYSEHQVYAAKYRRALNAREIRR